MIHNLQAGGAHRRLAEHLARFEAEVVELCPSTAEPIRADAHVIALRPVAPRVARPLRVPLRYLDLGALVRVWRAIAARVSALAPDVVYANPCRYLQTPPALLSRLPPSLYFCDEPRRVDAEPAARASRNPATRPVYAPLYAAERALDRRACGRATRVVTNSAYSATAIERAYGRPAGVIPLGAADLCRAVAPAEPTHVLSVGTLIPSKGHDIVIAAAGRAARGWPVLVVAPRADAHEAGRLQALARELGVALEIRVAVSDHELARAYAAAQATLSMARAEPLGLVSLEAQAAGSPVIVAAEGGLPETIVPGRTGWAVARDAASAAAALDALEQSGVRAAMSRAARAHAGKATWARSARVVEDLLEQLRA